MLCILYNSHCNVKEEKKMAKNECQLITASVEEQLLSKQAIALPAPERLSLLLSAKYYPIVTKATSAEAQIKEMIALYNLCGLMLTKYFPDENAEANYIKLAIAEMAEEQNYKAPITERMDEAFELVRNYEEFERKITAIKNLFWQYSEYFPEIFDKYNLEDYATENILHMLENSRYMLESCPSAVKRIADRWELL